jgi:hypothetical protein
VTQVNENTITTRGLKRLARGPVKDFIRDQIKHKTPLASVAKEWLERKRRRNRAKTGVAVQPPKPGCGMVGTLRKPRKKGRKSS